MFAGHLQSHRDQTGCKFPMNEVHIGHLESCRSYVSFQSSELDDFGYLRMFFRMFDASKSNYSGFEENCYILGTCWHFNPKDLKNSSR